MICINDRKFIEQTIYNYNLENMSCCDYYVPWIPDHLKHKEKIELIKEYFKELKIEDEDDVEEDEQIDYW